MEEAFGEIPCWAIKVISFKLQTTLFLRSWTVFFHVVLQGKQV